MDDAILVLTTVASEAAAEQLAQTLVAERLAACVQLAPVTSWYRWQGAVEHAAEVRLAIKTTSGLADAVTARITALHSYALPEIVTVPITGGSAIYLDWLRNSVSDDPPAA